MEAKEKRLKSLMLFCWCFFSEKSLSRRWTCFQVQWCFIPNHSPSEWSVLLGILGCHNSTWRVFPQVRLAEVANQKSLGFVCCLSDSIPWDSSPWKNYHFGGTYFCVFFQTPNNPIWNKKTPRLTLAPKYLPLEFLFWNLTKKEPSREG